MRHDPIDFDSPLGISKREWTRVLGANLVLLLVVYAIAVVCTLCGNDTFILNFNSEALQRIEKTLRGWGIFALVQFLFVAVEATAISCFAINGKPKFWIPLVFYGSVVAADLICWAAMGTFPGVVQFLVILLCHVAVILALKIKQGKKELLFSFLRLAIGMAVSFLLNGVVTVFRTKAAEIWQQQWSNSAMFALSLEYDIALVLCLLFLWLVLPFGQQKKGDEPCPTECPAGGSSPTTKTKSPKNSPTKTSEISPKTKKRLRILKIKVFTIQTIALIVIAFLPWAVGRPVEFSLVYASFCLTRVILGFSHSLHFKSELSCVTIGAIVFWLLTLLSPPADVSIIMALAYGATTAIGFRLYWELHDLILYKRAAKLDRYAMFYTAFKGNLDPRHIYGVMRMRGYDKDSINIVQAYMRKDKVEAIAIDACYSKRVIEDKLTEMAKDLYGRR